MSPILLFVCKKVSGSTGSWSQIHCVAKDNLEFLILLHPPRTTDVTDVCHSTQFILYLLSSSHSKFMCIFSFKQTVLFYLVLVLKTPFLCVTALAVLELTL